MQSWSVLAVLVAAGAAACTAPAARPVLPGAIPSAPRVIRVGVVEGGRMTFRSVPLEEYVAATIISEFAPGDGDPIVVERMLEVQAVIGRTYALSHLGRHARERFDLCASTHCQLFQPSRLRTSRWAAQAAEAVRRTSGTVLVFDGVPANALFHADCGGHGPADVAHSLWRFEEGRTSVQRALNTDPRTRVGARLDGIQVLERDPAGRAEQVALHGTEERIVRGEALRDVLTQAFGGRTIRSTWFDVRRERDAFVFEGRGFGHGVGLCQAGALARIRAGALPPAILQRYFPGTRLLILG
jgi:stage II sporulation protein D